MQLELFCPGCGVRSVDFGSYRSTVMLAPNLALMRFDCPCCQTPLHVNVKLNRAQQDLLATRADRPLRGWGPSGPGDGHSQVSYSALQVVDSDSDILQILVAPPASTPEARSRLIDFHEQLEKLESVDEAIWRIDASRRGGLPPE